MAPSNNKCHNAECPILFIVMLNVILLSVVIQSVVAPQRLLFLLSLKCLDKSGGAYTCRPHSYGLSLPYLGTFRLICKTAQETTTLAYFVAVFSRRKKGFITVSIVGVNLFPRRM
jgi:hypothetical protein